MVIDFRILKISICVFLFTSIGYSVDGQKTNPPGTIWLKDNLYIDETPVVNIHYREYYYSLTTLWNYNLDTLEKVVNKLPKYGFQNIKSLMSKNGFAFNPDTASLIINQAAMKPMTKDLSYRNYWHNNDYNYYPLVNVDYRIAENFCRWRTLAVKMLYATSATEKERAAFYDNIQYRLPTYEEMVFALTKFHAEEKIKAKYSASHAFLVDFKNVPRKKVYLTSLHEIVSKDHQPYSVQWNIDKNKIVGVTPIVNTGYNVNTTFRCVCEVQ